MVNIDLYTEFNSWQLADRKKLSENFCPMTNSAVTFSSCMECSNPETYENGLSFSYNNSTVTFVQNDTLVHFPILNGNSIGDRQGPFNIPNGSSLLELDLNTKSPPQDEFGERAAIFNNTNSENSYLVVSAPDYGIGDTRTGAIQFYTWNATVEKWTPGERYDGNISGQRLGSKSLQFLDNSTLEVVSDRALFTYFIYSSVSRISHLLQVSGIFVIFVNCNIINTLCF